MVQFLPFGSSRWTMRNHVRFPVIVSIIAAWTMLSASAQVVDRVRLVEGRSESGEIDSMSSTAVQIKQGTQRTSVPVNEILTIQFDQEPIELTQARADLRNGDYRQALESLGKLNAADIRRAEIRNDFEFQTALARSRAALASHSEQDLLDAGRAMNDFIKAHENSFHYFEAVEVLGDILAAMGRFDQAQARYATLASSPWPDFKIRAAVLEGRTLAAQGKHAEAARRFDDALTIESTAPAAAEHRLAARLGKAQSQAEVGQTDEALAAVEQIIAEAQPEALELQGRAHNVLGVCHLKDGSPKEALYAFLYVEILCSSVPDAHAEALYQLIPLFRNIGREEDARIARERLLEKYPQSPWARRLAQEEAPASE